MSIEKKFSAVQKKVAKEKPDLESQAAKAEAEQLRHDLERAKEALRLARDEIQLQGELVQNYRAVAEEKEKLAEHDSRTGLLNKLGFDRRARPIFNMFARGTSEAEKREETGVAFNLIFLDIDNFKAFNSTYGHAGGDAVIKGVGDVIRATMRPGDLVCRWGGEEYATAFMSSKEGVNRVAQDRGIVAERLRRAIEKATFMYNGQPLKVTVSVGAAKVEPGETYEDFFARASLAMNLAKERGRNQIVIAEVETEGTPAP